jgi:hypothetical protein
MSEPHLRRRMAKTINLTVTIDRALRDKLLTVADANGISASLLLRKLLAAALANDAILKIAFEISVGDE